MFTAVLSICKVFTYLASRIYCLEPFNNGSEQYKTKTLIFFFFLTYMVRYISFSKIQTSYFYQLN